MSGGRQRPKPVKAETRSGLGAKPEGAAPPERGDGALASSMFLT